MKIAQVPPLYESVPPKLYGGTERVVAYLTEELITKGHDITIFGTGDSVTSAKLHQISQQALQLGAGCKDALAWHTYQLQEVVEHSEEFDIIHFHTDYSHFPVSTLGRISLEKRPDKAIEIDKTNWDSAQNRCQDRQS